MSKSAPVCSALVRNQLTYLPTYMHNEHGLILQCWLVGYVDCQKAFLLELWN